jgi:hypothetical protein
MNAMHSITFKRYCPILASIGSITVISISFAVIIGWVFNIGIITSLPRTHIIWANTAICFMLSGITLLFLQQKNPQKAALKVFQIFPIIILLISSLTLCEYLFGFNLGIDQIFIHNFPISAVLHPGRMAILTTLNFLFTGISLLFLVKKRNPWISQVLAGFILILTILSLINNINGVNVYTYYLAQSTTMALNTTILFLIISAGILLTTPDQAVVEIILGNNSIGYMLRSVMPVMLVSPILLTSLVNKADKLGIWDAKYGDSIVTIGFYFIMLTIIIIMVRAALSERLKQVLTENKLEKNDILFHEFAERIDEVFFISSLDFKSIVYISPAFTKIWELEVEALYKNPLLWYEAIIDEDKERKQNNFPIC